MIARLLIANRGEVVRRIARTCRRMGVEFVTVHSEIDAEIATVEGAAASICIGAASPGESYLNIDRLIAAARQTGCDAVHPGYGFLSENAAFVRAVEHAGMTFVGPDAGTIESMGDKARAKTIMAGAGVPIIPGSADATEDPQAIASRLDETGLPALLKPAAGGGGKGMQVVHAADQIDAAVASAIRIARASFGDGRLLVERLIVEPRHIEVQVFGDAHGSVVHLFERECTLQRRHQKIVEEAPAAALDERIRRALLSAAIRGARSIGYRNAGTFEFIVDRDGAFYFLEVNTRLQVEHPVTEEVTGIDLVEWQIRVARGEPLPLQQEEITARGHAVECRIYAEDPANEFRPSPGRVLKVSWPGNLRIETAISDGTEITPHYDPMVAKLIASSATRDQALQKMREGLRQTYIHGVTTNVAVLDTLLADQAVVDASACTSYVDAHLGRLVIASRRLGHALACAAAIQMVVLRQTAAGPSPWLSYRLAAIGDRARLDPAAPLGRISVRHGDQVLTARLFSLDEGERTVRVNIDPESARWAEQTHTVALERDGPLWWAGRVDDIPWSAIRSAQSIDLVVAGQRTLFALDHPEVLSCEGDRVATAPMAGTVVVVNVSEGELVTRGTVLAVVEAMKMENGVRALSDGRVTQILASAGDSVAGGQALIVLEPRRSIQQSAASHQARADEVRGGG